MTRIDPRRAGRATAAGLAAVVLGGCAATAAQPAGPPGRPLHPATRSSGCVRRGPLPDPACTPGSVRTTDRGVVCTPGSSRRARNVSFLLKLRIYRAYGVLFHRRGSYEIDHLVPLELGGANDAANLWPQPAQPAPGFHEKDALENRLHQRVCAGALSLPVAQREIAGDWVALWQRGG